MMIRDSGLLFWATLYMWRSHDTDNWHALTRRPCTSHQASVAGHNTDFLMITVGKTPRHLLLIPPARTTSVSMQELD